MNDKFCKERDEIIAELKEENENLANELIAKENDYNFIEEKNDELRRDNLNLTF